MNRFLVRLLAPTAQRARTRDAAEPPSPGTPVGAVGSGDREPVHPPGTAPLAAHDVKVALARTRAALKKARRSPEATDPVVVTMLDDVEAATLRARADLRAGAPLAELTDRWQDRVDAAARRAVSQDFDRIQSDLAVIAAIDLPAEEDMVWPEELALAVERMSRHDLSPLASIAPLRELLDAVAVDRPPDTR
jgi:cellulose synthase (UDP-forming)